MTLMHYIGGAETAGTSGRQQDVFNPATGAAITTSGAAITPPPGWVPELHIYIPVIGERYCA